MEVSADGKIELRLFGGLYRILDPLRGLQSISSGAAIVIVVELYIWPFDWVGFRIRTIR